MLLRKHFFLLSMLKTVFTVTFDQQNACLSIHFFFFKIKLLNGSVQYIYVNMHYMALLSLVLPNISSSFQHLSLPQSHLSCSLGVLRHYFTQSHFGAICIVKRAIQIKLTCLDSLKANRSHATRAAKQHSKWQLSKKCICCVCILDF